MADEKQAQPGKDFKHLVRIMNTDIKGEKHILISLTKIKGIGIMFANAICRKAKVSIFKQAGYLTSEEVAALEKVIKNPIAAGLPLWMLNRRNDYESGDDKHLLTGDLLFTHEVDIKRMKKTKSYKGLRHQWGLTVRGQRTGSNFRKNKGKGSLGVKKKKVKSGKT